MLKELKCSVFIESPELQQMLSEDGLALDVEHADVIEITTAPTVLKETIEESRDWQDVADELLDEFSDTFGWDWKQWEAERSEYIVSILENAPGRPDVETVQHYCDDVVLRKNEALEA